MTDLIDRQMAIDIERNATVDTNPSHFEAHQKFTQFMDDAEVSSFGRWQWSNGFNTALTAVGIDLKKLPSAQPDHVTDVSKKDERTAEFAQNVQNGDLIQREAAIDALARMMPRSYTPDGSHPADEEIFRAQEVFADCIEALEILPSAQPEPLTDKEQRIFLAAMRREEKVCKQVDGLVRTCHEIIRKVKGTLWT